jgi:YVTN family beta-propeller protein
MFTMNGGSGDASAIDPATGTVVATLALGGQPEEPACDGSGRMYVNLEDSSKIVTVDTRASRPRPLATRAGRGTHWHRARPGTRPAVLRLLQQ